MKEEWNQEAIRQFAALLLARAVQRTFPGAKLGQGATAGEGFHYDLDVPRPLSESDLAPLEAEMKRLAAEGWRPAYRQASREEAIRVLESRGEKWKVEWLQALPPEEPVGLWEQEDFLDASAIGGLPELPPEAPAFKLQGVAGAYWQGDSSREVLQRIYGAAFAAPEELEAYLQWQEEAQKRDHRKLGKQLELFMFAEEAPGMPFYLPKGTLLRNALENLSREFLAKYGYQEIRTPLIMDRQMWEQSGHWDHYRENMYFSELDGRQYAVKPMNCPGHMLVYRNRQRSYRDLPLRLAEFGQVHRYEYSGALNGLFRVRTFCQDDAHIFATPEQIGHEVGRAIELIKEMYGIFGFEYSLELSTRPSESLGSDEQWAEAEAVLSRVLDEAGLPYRVNPGDGAFYGPKIDFHIRDALRRSHQCGTIQLDFQMPDKFGLSYVDESNDRKTPIVIHRAVYGSIDRFLGILIEHYAGAFPVWLAPVQVRILPVAGSHAGYAEEVCGRLEKAGIRAEVDGRGEKLGYRIREAQVQKIPYLAVVGDQEAASGCVSIRERGAEQTRSCGVEAFAEELLANSRNRGGRP
ncbi:threonine--tRNA ligase [Gorillibacterium sp. sgz5001074]|uniref:threonine--tRNA ligase n=1 Tax=Gorillibacterium sp. sgz5001074 TaxID=3446695 RepID=UPI003F674736